MPIQKDLSLANRLISALPARERGLFLEQSELVEIRLHNVLIEPGEAPAYAYFPVDSFVSVVLPVEDAPNVQVALVGNEGMFGTGLVLDVATSAFISVVQRAGRAYRIDRDALQQRLDSDAPLRRVLHRYVAVRQSHLAQQAVCINQHSVKQRLARWLLMIRDRAHSRELFVTHQVLAMMLGVRRESVTRAANSFEQRGLISYSPGYVMLLDEAALQRVTCRCYQVDLTVYEHILGIHPVTV